MFFHLEEEIALSAPPPSLRYCFGLVVKLVRGVANWDLAEYTGQQKKLFFSSETKIKFSKATFRADSKYAIRFFLARQVFEIIWFIILNDFGLFKQL